MPIRAGFDSGPFRQPVVRSRGAVRRRGVALRRIPFRAGESLVTPVRPSPTKDAFSIGDSNRFSQTATPKRIAYTSNNDLEVQITVAAYSTLESRDIPQCQIAILRELSHAHPPSTHYR